jgi:putative membrane protein
LITFLVNALMLWLTGAISNGTGLHFSMEGFWAASWGALVISVVSWILDLLLPD